MSELAFPHNYEKWGALTPAQTAQYMAAMLWDFGLVPGCGTGGIPAPYWDDDEDNDDEATPEDQPWYGKFIDPEGFQATLENWVIAGFVAYAGGIGAAATFLTLAPRFRLAWRTSDYGGLIRVFIDGADAGTVDTNTETVGVLEKTFLGDPDVEEHEILMVLEDAPPQPFPTPPNEGGSGNAGMSIIRRRLNNPINIFPAFRYNPDTGNVEVTTDGTTWVSDAGADPRYNTAYQKNMIGKHRCGVAAGVTTQIEKWAQAAAASAVLVTLANNLFGNALELIPVDGALADLYTYVAGIVKDIGVEAIQDAFDEDALRRIKCILLTCLGEDSAFTAAELERAQLAVSQEFGDTIVTECFNLLAQSWGQVGFTNAGWVNYDAGADCDCDECPVAYVDSLQTGIGWRTFPLAENPDAPATYLPTGGRTGGGVLKANTYQSKIRVDVGRDCYIQHYSIWHRKLSAANSYIAVWVRVYTEAGALVYNQQVRAGNSANSNWVQDYRIIGVATGRYIEFIHQISTGGVGLHIDDIEVTAHA